MIITILLLAFQLLLVSSTKSFAENQEYRFELKVRSWKEMMEECEVLCAGKIINIEKRQRANYIIEKNYLITNSPDPAVFHGCWYVAQFEVDNIIIGADPGKKVEVWLFREDEESLLAHQIVPPPAEQKARELWEYTQKVEYFPRMETGKRYMLLLTRLRVPGRNLGVTFKNSVFRLADSLPPDLSDNDEPKKRFCKEFIHAYRKGVYTSPWCIYLDYWRTPDIPIFYWELVENSNNDFHKSRYLRILVKMRDIRATRAMWEWGLKLDGGGTIKEEYENIDDISVTATWLELQFSCETQEDLAFVLGVVPELATIQNDAFKFMIADILHSEIRVNKKKCLPEMPPLLISLLNSDVSLTRYFAYATLRMVKPGIAPLPVPEILDVEPEKYIAIWLDWWEKEGKKKYPSLEESLAKFAKEVAEQEKKDARDSKRNGDDGK